MLRSFLIVSMQIFLDLPLTLKILINSKQSILLILASIDLTCTWPNNLTRFFRIYLLLVLPPTYSIYDNCYLKLKHVVIYPSKYFIFDPSIFLDILFFNCSNSNSKSMRDYTMVLQNSFLFYVFVYCVTFLMHFFITTSFFFYFHKSISLSSYGS